MGFYKKTIGDIDLNGKTVLIRADFNVPLSEDGVITDDYRIRANLPTIEHVRSQNTKIILISHLGRPKSAQDVSCSLKPVATKLTDLLHLPVKFVEDCVGDSVRQTVNDMQQGDIILLENLRYHSEEEENNEDFAKQLASLADVFVQDGFGVVHRAHASTEAITKFIPSVAGLLLEREVDTITRVMEQPDRPLAVVIGGAKIADKIELLQKFIETADYVAVVGAMANTFLLAENVQVGSSLAEKDKLDFAKQILQKAKERTQNEQFTFYLPQDVVVSKDKEGYQPTRVVDITAHTYADITSYPKQPEEQNYTVQPEELILDIGPMSAASIAGALKLSKTAIWNGTAGVTETNGIAGSANPFAHGTKIIAAALSGEPSAKNKPFSVVGGGDTVGFVESVPSLRERLNHVSTGGGASLELMAGKSLPGVEALLNKDS